MCFQYSDINKGRLSYTDETDIGMIDTATRTVVAVNGSPLTTTASILNSGSLVPAINGKCGDNAYVVVDVEDQTKCTSTGPCCAKNDRTDFTCSDGYIPKALASSVEDGKCATDTFPYTC
jgi:hypothetical protein